MIKIETEIAEGAIIVRKDVYDALWSLAEAAKMVWKTYNIIGELKSLDLAIRHLDEVCERAVDFQSPLKESDFDK